MSSDYEGYVKSLNPLYYWPLEQGARELYVGTTNLGDTYTKFYQLGDSSYGYFYSPESSQLYSNTSMGSYANSRGFFWGYWADLAIDLDDESPRPQGPIFGGGGSCLRNSVGGSATYSNLGTSGWEYGNSTYTHEVGIGRNTDCTWIIWVKAFEDLADGGSRHMLTSGPSSGTAAQHLMFGENRGSDGTQKLKVKTKLGSSNSNVITEYTWDAKKWNMWAVTMPETGSSETITDGIGVHLNGQKVLSVDAVGSSMPEGGDMGVGAGETRMWALGAWSTGPSRMEGMFSHVANWKRILSDSEISDLYYHATSPSPSRVRGGLYKQLGRLV